MPSFGSGHRTLLKSTLSISAVSCVALLLGACASTDEGISASTLVSDQVTGSTGSQRMQAGADSGLDALTMARRLKADGQKQQAAELLGDALSRTPQDRELLSEQGRLLLDLGEVDKAAELLALADDPASPDWRVLSARGTVLAKQGQYPEARAFYERAMAIAPGEPAVLNNLALVHAATGNADLAVRMLREALTKGSDPRTQRNLDLVLSLSDKPEQFQSAVWGTTVASQAAPTPARRSAAAAPGGAPATPTLRRRTTD